jgi:hypothetical protein
MKLKFRNIWMSGMIYGASSWCLYGEAAGNYEQLIDRPPFGKGPEIEVKYIPPEKPKPKQPIGLQFTGVVKRDGDVFVIIFNEKTKQSYVIRVGDRQAEYYILEYDAERKTITIAMPDGTQETLALKEEGGRSSQSSQSSGWNSSYEEDSYDRSYGGGSTYDDRSPFDDEGGTDIYERGDGYY